MPIAPIRPVTPTVTIAAAIETTTVKTAGLRAGRAAGDQADDERRDRERDEVAARWRWPRRDGSAGAARTQIGTPAVADREVEQHGEGAALAPSTAAARKMPNICSVKGTPPPVTLNVGRIAHDRDECGERRDQRKVGGARRAPCRRGRVVDGS